MILPTSPDTGNSDQTTHPASSPLLGVWVSRCIQLELFVAIVLMITLYFGTASGLRALGEPEESIPIACEFVNALLIGLPFIGIYYALTKALQASNIVVPILLIVLIVKSCEVIIVWSQLFHWSYTIVGCAWTLSCASMLQLFGVWIYMSHTGIIEAWWGKDEDDIMFRNIQQHEVTSCCEAFLTTIRGIGSYSLYAIPACLTVCLEFMLFDLCGFLSGLVLLSHSPSIEVSTHYILFSCCFGGFMIFSGVSVGVSVNVGQHLGREGEYHLAQRCAKVGLVCCACISMCIVMILLTSHSTIGSWFTNDIEVLQRFEQALPSLIFFTMFDGLNTCATQLLRVLGQQKYAVFVHLTTYYMIGISIGTILCFWYDLGVIGLWIGLGCGIGLNGILCTIWLWKFIDWRQQSEAAIKRTRDENQQVEVGMSEQI